jgi:Caspase domain
VRTDLVLSTMALWLRRLARPVGPLLCALAAVAFLHSPAVADVQAEKRVALVVGNGAYQNAPSLDNAVLDARAVADAFRKLGFEVVDGYDLDIGGMRAKVAEFSGDLPGAKSAVVYYAGHGISVDEENYLIPTDIELRRSRRDQRLARSQADEARRPSQRRHPRRLPRQSVRRGTGEKQDPVDRWRPGADPDRRRLSRAAR